MKSYRPSPGRVLIRRDSVGKQSAGGIIIPDQSREFGREATVLAVGEVRDGPEWLKVGDRVRTNKYSGLALENVGDDGEIALVKDDEVYCVVLGDELVPHPGKVIVERDPAQSVSAGGIVIPDTAQRHGREATVVAAGAPASGWLSPGDRVLVNRGSGQALDDGGNLAMVDEAAIGCVVA